MRMPTTCVAVSNSENNYVVDTATRLLLLLWRIIANDGGGCWSRTASGVSVGAFAADQPLLPILQQAPMQGSSFGPATFSWGCSVPEGEYTAPQTIDRLLSGRPVGCTTESDRLPLYSGLLGHPPMPMLQNLPLILLLSRASLSRALLSLPAGFRQKSDAGGTPAV